MTSFKKGSTFEEAAHRREISFEIFISEKMRTLLNNVQQG